MINSHRGDSSNPRVNNSDRSDASSVSNMPIFSNNQGKTPSLFVVNKTIKEVVERTEEEKVQEAEQTENAEEVDNAEEEKVQTTATVNKKRRSSRILSIDILQINNRDSDEIKSSTLQHIDLQQWIPEDEEFDTNNEDDEELIEDDDQDDSDDREEEDEDECIESRPFTPENKKPLECISGSKKPIVQNKNNLNSTSYRGAFTCKIVKKKAQDLEKGKVVAFGSTAARNNDDMSTQQILERNKKIHKHYQGPYKKKKNISLYCAVPKNLEEQKDLFFESEFKYNPQFVYENENMTRRYLKQFYNEENKSPEGVPLADDELLKLATRILKAWIKDFGTETEYLQSEGKILTREETEKVLNSFNS